LKQDSGRHRACERKRDARIRHGRPRQKFTTAETAEVRKGGIGRRPYGFTAGRKRARNRFIIVLIATIERFQGWRGRPSGVDGLGMTTAGEGCTYNNGVD
jgi:hypothetical protein